MNAYFISGLGADKRAFDRIELPRGYEKNFLEWIEPHRKETFEHYARRMAKDIDTSKPFILVGLSFGGILCQKINTFLNPEKIILISTITSHTQLPTYLRTAGKLKMHHAGFLPLLKKNDTVMNWAFGVRSQKLKEYLKEMINKTTDNYLLWSLDTILAWKQEKKPSNCIHIHGSTDKLFPISYCTPDYTIKGGSHFMVMTHAKKINEIVTEELKK